MAEEFISCFSPVCLNWDTGLLLPLDWHVHHWLVLIAGLWSITGFPVSPVWDGRLWDFSVPIIVWASSHNESPYLSTCLSVSYWFSGEPWLIHYLTLFLNLDWERKPIVTCYYSSSLCTKETHKWLVLFINEKKLSKLNIIKLTIIPKAIFGFNATPLNILTGSFTELDDMISKSFVKLERQ